jgi:hypothetical protein
VTTTDIATAEARLSDVHAVYSVTMTNGSGVREVVLSGTQATVWLWCCRAGETPSSDLAGFVPVDIRQASIVQTSASCACGQRESYSLACPVHGLVALV